MTYYAKSKTDSRERITVKDHLIHVMTLAEQFGSEIGFSTEARIAGQMHDFGKYGQLFQDVLAGLVHNIDHAIPGAVVLSKKAKCNIAYRAIVEAISGHHNGLFSYESIENILINSISTIDPIYSKANKQISLQGIDQYKLALSAFQDDFGNVQFPSLISPVFTGGRLENMVQMMLYVRMIYSCLVDADYSASAMEENVSGLYDNDCAKLDAKTALLKLNQYRENIKASSTADAKLNLIRDNVYDDCTCAGDGNDNLLTLTAPTGTGKTLALLNLALRKCIDNDLRSGKKRIIIVLPFLSLSDQTESIYRNIIPDLLVDNSQAELDDNQRLMSERWSAGCIITTSVQFFESLFSSKPGDCRKLHNIANSVIVFDEAQTLPLDLTRISMYALKELGTRYNCSVVLSTATQPAYDHMPLFDWHGVEISKHAAENFDKTRRVDVVWSVEKPVDVTDISDIVARQSTNTAVIFNLKRHARDAFLSSSCPNRFLISTDLCPAHRRDIISRVREYQKTGLECHVISTSCIEAGVDLDFDMLYRALAPLPSVVQSAGRCNRNGRLSSGKVYVFEPKREKEFRRLYPNADYEHQSMVVKAMLSRSGIDISNPDFMTAYYARLFDDYEDVAGLKSAILHKDYEMTRQSYKLIDNQGLSVIVPYAGQIELYNAILSQVISGLVTKHTIRQVAPIVVTTYDVESVKAHCQELIIHNKRTNMDISTGYYILLPGHEACYDNEIGLNFTEGNEMYII